MYDISSWNEWQYIPLILLLYIMWMLVTLCISRIFAEPWVLSNWNVWNCFFYYHSPFCDGLSLCIHLWHLPHWPIRHLFPPWCVLVFLHFFDRTANLCMLHIWRPPMHYVGFLILWCWNGYVTVNIMLKSTFEKVICTWKGYLSSIEY
jgi:hypothetical protein